MRQAFELAWANAALYCKSRPAIWMVDDIIFRKPVEVGSLLFFSSQIVYTKGSLMLVNVHAEVLDILTRSRDTTNHFYFVFDSKQPDMPRVVPHTYAESMLYLDGMRHMKD
ncbi:acyl-coenzyme A thioesterase 10, mitochondrial-like [Babylonia areolata]|uniref:acyl-coenzyme A thioesterase 10, mitochondrial-like n=1 Tax=Babylonia areolata TaxID=304850 RepID=UPI003FD23FF6